MHKTLKELGAIIIANKSLEAIRDGYGIDPDDVEEVGRQALKWKDINADGTLN